MESDAFDLVIEGEGPQDLYGAFFRNGPNPQFPRLANTIGSQEMGGFTPSTSRTEQSRIRIVGFGR